MVERLAQRAPIVVHEAILSPLVVPSARLRVGVRQQRCHVHPRLLAVVAGAAHLVTRRAAGNRMDWRVYDLERRRHRLMSHSVTRVLVSAHVRMAAPVAGNVGAYTSSGETLKSQ